ncbi:ABC transporter ATP-binding protein YtrB [Clostridiales bacterium]|nr:ABC transporter ATP-binding protein YtrB [Clostridiales bacterium]
MIKTEKLTKKFGTYTALQDISCTIQDGCIYGMVGSNGAGKSTFLRILSGVYKADGGTALLDGEPIYENAAAKGQIMFVPDELYYINGASMNRMAALYQSMYPNFNRERYNELTKELGLDPKKSLNTFSKGMRRQAITVLALAASPKYIFFDETFDGMDPVVRNYVKKLICQDVIDRGAAAIITSHSLRELEDTCDQLALLHRGGLVLESDIQNLKTSQFKIQIAFREEYDKSKFSALDLVHFTKHGSVANLIVRGTQEETLDILRPMNPALLEVLPLTLEEVFTYEMEALGYTFNLE